MKKPLAAIMIAILLAVTIGHVHNMKPAPTPVDPQIIHVPAVNKDATINLNQMFQSNDRPEWNDFNDKDQVVVDRHTNTFYIYSITGDAFEAFERESNYMAFKGVKVITINLHSPGGEMDSAYFITEQIRLLKAEGIKVNTIIDKKNACMSACPMIFLAGDTRTASENSVIMLHAVYAQFPYNVSEPVINEIEHELRLDRERYAHRLEEVCTKDTSIAMDVLDHKEHFYLAKDLDTRCGGNTFFTQVIPVIEQSPAIPDLGIPGLKIGSVLKSI